MSSTESSTCDTSALGWATGIGWCCCVCCTILVIIMLVIIINANKNYLSVQDYAAAQLIKNANRLSPQVGGCGDCNIIKKLFGGC